MNKSKQFMQMFCGLFHEFKSKNSKFEFIAFDRFCFHGGCLRDLFLGETPKDYDILFSSINCMDNFVKFLTRNDLKCFKICEINPSQSYGDAMELRRKCGERGRKATRMLEFDMNGCLESSEKYDDTESYSRGVKYDYLFSERYAVRAKRPTSYKVKILFEEDELTLDLHCTTYVQFGTDFTVNSLYMGYDTKIFSKFLEIPALEILNHINSKKLIPVTCNFMWYFAGYGESQMHQIPDMANLEMRAKKMIEKGFSY